MKATKLRKIRWTVRTSVWALALPVVVHAAPCAEFETTRSLYGIGGGAVTATLRSVATALAGLDESQQLTLFFNDSSVNACAAYKTFLAPPSGELNFRTWSTEGVESSCQAPASKLAFAHMGNTPLLCPDEQPVAPGYGQFAAPVQTINLITHFDSSYNEISAEALYHIYGFGAGVPGRSVAPWTKANGVFARSPVTFTQQILAGALGMEPAAFKVPTAEPNNVLASISATVSAVYNWGESSSPQEPLGFVSGSAADQGEEDEQVKTLGYQHYGQSCAYLPDTSRVRKDKAHVRSGQYYLWTPAWFFAAVNESGEIEDDLADEFIHWMDGTEKAPDGVDLQELIIHAGDVPLCAMRAMRPQGDLSPIESYAPKRPCNGYFEFIATGATDYVPCDDGDACGESEICSYGFCEVTYPEIAR